jgi:phage-related protein
MGIGDNVKTILRNVKKIGGIPDKVISDIKKELKKVHEKMDDINAMAALEEFMAMLMLSLEKHFRTMERRTRSGFNSMTRTVTSSLNTIQSEFEAGIKNINNTMANLTTEMREGLDEAISFAAKLKDDIFEAMGPFVKKLWSKYMPYIVVVLIVLSFPYLAPVLMPLFKMVF